jgi:replication factor A1
MFSLDTMIQKLSEHAKLDPDRIRSMIAEKQDELSGLVSEEGAAYIIARELGLNVIRETRKQLRIKNLVSGLRSVDIAARIVRIFDEREFERDGKKGCVINLLLGDETGMVRLSLWNEETAPIKEKKLKEGDTIRISGGWVKTDNRDNLEMRIGRGSMEKSDRVIELPDTTQMEQSFQSVKRGDIADFKEGGQHEVRAAFIQAFRRNPFFGVCPECGSRVRQSDGRWVCDDHGEIKPDYALVLSGIIDDGTENIRAVFFREAAERIFGKKTGEIKEISDNADDPLVVFDGLQSLGREFVFTGRVKRNSFTDSLEFVVSNIEDPDISKEAEQLLGQIS